MSRAEPPQLPRPIPAPRRVAAWLGVLLLLVIGPGCRKTGGVPGLASEPAAATAGFGGGSPFGGGGRLGRGGNAAIGGRRDNEPAEGSGGSAGSLAVAGSSGGGEGHEQEPPAVVGSPREALLGAVSRCVVREARALGTDADALVSATEAHAAAPSDATAERVRSRWLDVMQRWQRLELFQFGPLGDTTIAGGRALRSGIYAWPSFNRCFIDQQTATRYYADPGFGEALPNTRGLAAIEYLTFHGAPDNGCATTHALNQGGSWAALGDEEVSSRRAAYAGAAAADVRSRVLALVEAWEPSAGNFSRELAMAGSGSSLYPSLRAGLNAVSDAMFYLDTEVKDMKLAWPLGIADCSGPCPSVAEAPFSGHSKLMVRQNLLGFRMLYEGCNEAGQGLGFDDVLIEIGQDDLAERMRGEVAAALAAVDAIEEPSIEAAVARDRESADALYFAVKAVTDSLKTDFVTVLDLARPMGAEGDND